jgi:hypothetical protein
VVSTPTNAWSDTLLTGLWSEMIVVSPGKFLNALSGMLEMLLCFRLMVCIVLDTANAGMTARPLESQSIVLASEHVQGEGAGHLSIKNEPTVDTSRPRQRVCRGMDCKESIAQL